MKLSLIPDGLLAEFMAVMQANDDDDAPDGAWWARLHETAEKFMKDNGIKGDAGDAIIQYTRGFK
jgi:hypothetical protein